MSAKKSFYVSDPDNYIQKQVVRHLTKTVEEKYNLRVSYPEGKEPLQKSAKISKILKHNKPKLFQHYLLKTDILLLDFVLNESAERDLDLIEQAVLKNQGLWEADQNRGL